METQPILNSCPGHRGHAGRALLAPLVLFALLLAGNVRAALQFDVYLGLDNYVPEASWFPVVCEVYNDGPAFNGTVEVTVGMGQSGYPRLVPIELPTGTRKRLTIPMFCSGAYNGEWHVLLRHENGRVLEERANLRPQRIVNRHSTLLGALPRQLGWSPPFKAVSSRNNSLQPVAARLLPPLVPDNPIVLEGMDALYLSSERATDLRAQQIEAVLTWVQTGGHLIVGIDQAGDLNASRWLKDILPVTVSGTRQLKPGNQLENWLRSRVRPSVLHTGAQRGNANKDSKATMGEPYADTLDDLAFGAAELSVITTSATAGKTELAVEGSPLIVSAPYGLGKVTALLFSPEREPVKSWKNAGVFWSRLAEVSPAAYASVDSNYYGGWGLDGVFGAMIDSRQVRKLPIPWLLLLLLVYLAIIGPVDQFWLRKINRPMLTWITFPCYVALFSGLIYLVGYKLRAGESEWNELHVVDVFTGGEKAQLRGRTFGSVYSPVNQRYTFQSEAEAVTFRAEYAGSWNTSGTGDRGEVVQGEKKFTANVFVPVWTCQLYAADWLNTAEPPFFATVDRSGLTWKATVQNKMDRPLTHVRLVINEDIYDLPDVPARQVVEFSPSKEPSSALKKVRPLRSFLNEYQSRFQSAVQERRSAFGGMQSGRLTDLPNSAAAASFTAYLGNDNQYNSIAAPASFDLSGPAERGDAILLAWVPNQSPVKPLNQFSPRRSQVNTLWRMTLPAP